MSQIFTNNSQSTLSAGISSTATLIPVLDPTSFPYLTGTDYYLVTLQYQNTIEIVKVIAPGKDGSGNLTVDPAGRGQEGTANTSFIAGSRVEVRFTAGTINSIINNAAAATLAETNRAEGAENAETTRAEAAEIVAGNVAYKISVATPKPTPASLDKIGIWDSVSGLLNSLTFSALATWIQNTITVALAANGVPPGTVIDHAGSAAPTGYLLCPTTQLAAEGYSQATYPALYATVGTKWGPATGGNFTIPWFPMGYAAVQGNGGANSGTGTPGQVMNHVHQYQEATNTAPQTGSSTQCFTSNTTAQTTNPLTGGPANLAAGMYLIKCVKI